MTETTAVPAGGSTPGPAPGAAPPSAPPASGGTGAPSPAPTTGDRAGVTEATAPPAPGVTNPAATGAQNVAPETDGSDAAANLFPSEEELKRMPGQWRDRFGNLKTGYDSLASDHKELKTNWEPWKAVKEKFGDPAAVAQELEVLRAFRTIKTDEKGNPQYDQATGLPQYDVRPGIEKLAQQSPSMPGNLFRGLLRWTGESGENLAREFVRELGIDPDRIHEVRDFLSGKLNVASNNTGVKALAPEFLSQFAPEDQEAIKSMDGEILADFDVLSDGAQTALIAQAKRDLETRKFQDEVRNYQQEQARMAEDQFQNDLRQAQTTYVNGIRENTINSVVDSLNSQVVWSTDPTTQAVQQGVVRATLVSLLDPDFRFASAPMMQALGLQLDQSFDQVLGEIVNSAGLQTRYETYGKHPIHANKRDDFAMGQARQAVQDGVLRATAFFNNIALAIAQAMGAQVKARGQEIENRLATARARPVVTGTTPTGSEPPARTERRGPPFSKERWESRGLG